MCWSIGSCPWKTFQSTRVLEGEIYGDQIILPQPHGTPGSKKNFLAYLRVKWPESSQIQLGVSYSFLITIC